MCHHVSSRTNGPTMEEEPTKPLYTILDPSFSYMTDDVLLQ